MHKSFKISLLASLLCANVAYAETPPPPAPPATEPTRQFDLTEPAIQKTEQNLPAPAQADTQTQAQKMTSEELAQQPALLHHAMRSAVVQGDGKAIEILLPIYQQMATQDRPQDYDFTLKLAQATHAKNTNDFSSAIKWYREVIAEQPNLAFARLALAQALFADQQDEAAHDQFVRLRSEKDIPEPVLHITQQYLDALEKRSSWNISGGVSYVRDGNINNATQNTVVVDNKGRRWNLPAKESAQGLSYYASAERDWQIKNNFYWNTAANVNGKFYWDNHRYDDLLAKVQTGAVYKNAQREIGILPYFSRRWYGTDKYSRETGVRAEWSEWLGNRNKLFAAIETGREKYDRRRYLNSRSTTLSASWLFLERASRYWIVGADYSHNRNKQDASEGYKRKGIRLSWTQEWPWGISSSLGVSAAKRDYQSEGFLGEIRHDKEYAANLSLWHRSFHFKGITPRLVAVWQKNKSNYVPYNYQKTNAYIQLNKAF